MFMSWAFNLPRGRMLRDKWNLIPIDTDILVTHGPPLGILDQVLPVPTGGWDPDRGQPEHLGCEEMLIRVRTVRPKLHVFGHIHGGYGIHKDQGTTHVNASICDEDYRPVNVPVVLDLRKPRRSS
jgi:Icc-related predicted phosphoesterase